MGLFSLYYVYVKNRIIINNLEISETEKEKIASFYEINNNTIVRGENFDFKYVYRDPKQPFISVRIEMVSKNQEAIKIKNISYYDKNGTELCTARVDTIFISIDDINFSPFLRPSGGTNDYFRRDFQLYRKGYLLFDYCTLNDISLEDLEIGTYDLNEISITIRERTGIFGLEEKEETYHMVFDEEKQLMATKAIKDRYMSGEECNEYELEQINYYFGLLYYRDFEQWYTEIKEYLSYLKKDVHYIRGAYETGMYDIVNFPRIKDFENREELLVYLELNDDQVKKYSEIIEIMLQDFGAIFRYTFPAR